MTARDWQHLTKTSLRGRPPGRLWRNSSAEGQSGWGTPPKQPTCQCGNRTNDSEGNREGYTFPSQPGTTQPDSPAWKQ